MGDTRVSNHFYTSEARKRNPYCTLYPFVAERAKEHNDTITQSHQRRQYCLRLNIKFGIRIFLVKYNRKDSQREPHPIHICSRLLSIHHLLEVRRTFYTTSWRSRQQCKRQRPEGRCYNPGSQWTITRRLGTLVFQNARK